MKHPANMTPAERLDYFLQLPPNWDSYGALRIDPRAVTEARRLMDDLPDRWPVPLNNGGVALETPDGESQITILPDGSIYWEDE